MAKRAAKRVTGSDAARAVREALSGELTSSELEELMKVAFDVINHDYWEDVRGIGGDILEEIKKGDITTREQMQERVHEQVDGSGRVIYTFQARLGMLATNNVDAWEELGFDNPTVEQQMFAAMEADVFAWLDAHDEVQDLQD